MTQKTATLLLFILTSLLCLAGCPAGADAEIEIGAPVGLRADIPEAAAQPPVRLLISSVGDVMVHQSQITAQYDNASDTYDFHNNFKYVKKYIEGADLALCNLETTFGGKPYAGYPLFSAPDALAPALKDTGFDVVITANNHLLDRGVSGLKGTIEVLRANGLTPLGSRTSPDEPQYVILDVKGVKIGILAYTYATASSSGGLLVNGSAISAAAEGLVNYFRYSHLDDDLAAIKGTADEARSAGADIIIVYYHWGEEYQLRSNERQRYIAGKTVADIGADMIFASHPHTPQEVGFITNSVTGRQVPVFFSMGNFISNQRTETLSAPNVRYTEIGVIARVELDFDIENREILSLSAKAVPTWVDKYKAGGRDIYAIIPLDDEMDGNETLAASGHLSRARKALEDARGVLGEMEGAGDL